MRSCTDDAAARRDHPRHLGHGGRGSPTWCSEAKQYARSKEPATNGSASAFPSCSSTLSTPAAARRAAPSSSRLGGEVDAHDLAHARRHDLGCVRGTAAQVEDEHAVVERLELLHRSRGPAHERRVRTGEESHLTGERGAYEVVVVAHARHCCTPSAAEASAHSSGAVRSSDRQVNTLTPPGPTSSPTTINSDAGEHRAAEQRDDARDHQDHGDEPENECHVPLVPACDV